MLFISQMNTWFIFWIQTFFVELFYQFSSILVPFRQTSPIESDLIVFIILLHYYWDQTSALTQHQHDSFNLFNRLSITSKLFFSHKLFKNQFKISRCFTKTSGSSNLLYVKALIPKTDHKYPPFIFFPHCLLLFKSRTNNWCFQPNNKQKSNLFIYHSKQSSLYSNSMVYRLSMKPS